MKLLLAAAAVAALFSLPAAATVLQVDFSIPTKGNGGPATGSITVNNPFRGDVMETRSGVRAKVLSFNVDNDIGFLYTASSDSLVLGGTANGVRSVAGSGDDFTLTIVNLRSFPVLGVASIVQDGEEIVADGDALARMDERFAEETALIPGSATLPQEADALVAGGAPSVSVTELVVTPLPAGLPLLVGALAVLGIVARRRI